jgi:hypothetical protein
MVGHEVLLSRVLELGRASRRALAFDVALLAFDGGRVCHIHAGKRRLMLSAAKTVNATSGAVLNR